MAEWLALQTGKRGDSSSIPAVGKTFCGEESPTIHFELNFNFRLNFF